MLRVLSSVAATLVFASALGAAPGNSTPESLKGAPGQTQEAKPSHTAKAQVGKASWYGRIFQSSQDCKRRAVRHERFDGCPPDIADGFLGQGHRFKDGSMRSLFVLTTADLSLEIGSSTCPIVRLRF